MPPQTKQVNEMVDSNTFHDEPALVGFGARRTMNLGEFNSLTIEVSIRVPCSPDNVDASYEFAKKWVKERFVREVREFKEYANADKVNPQF